MLIVICPIIRTSHVAAFCLAIPVTFVGIVASYEPKLRYAYPVEFAVFNCDFDLELLRSWYAI